MVFPVVMYGCESWTIKKAECRRIDAFELVLEKILESALENKEIKPVNLNGSQSWIFIGRADAETEAPILWPLDVKSCLIRKNRDVGKDWGQEEKRRQRIIWLDGITNSVDMSLSKFQETVKNREAWHAAVHGVVQNRTHLINEQHIVFYCHVMNDYKT